MRLGGAGTGKPKKLALVTIAALFALVALTFVLYVNKLSWVSVSDEEATGSAGSHVYGQDSEELSPPSDVSVTVEKGVTIRWTVEDAGDAIGYNVYRYKSADDPGTKINAAIISDTVYHDDDGTMFNRYAVAPVDGYGREGEISRVVAAVADPVSTAELTPTQAQREVKDTTFEDSSEGAGLPPGIVDCTAAGMSYSGVWYLEHYAEVTGGTLMVTPYPGDSMSYTFIGESVAVISAMHWNYGIMAVYVDGELRQEVDLYSPQVKVGQRVFSLSGLGPGAHTIKLVCTGRKNADASFTIINLEALDIE